MNLLKTESDLFLNEDFTMSNKDEEIISLLSEVHNFLVEEYKLRQSMYDDGELYGSKNVRELDERIVSKLFEMQNPDRPKISYREAKFLSAHKERNKSLDSTQ